ncbi:MAG: hypothetical protein GDA54_05980 [Alphaproteobacteria bacterium GM7ARS4]|nr:hypothetical protein [Alphaproteobacteria bacterium GM7ARS4]
MLCHLYSAHTMETLKDTIRLRHHILRGIRLYFEEQGFYHVDTPHLQHYPPFEPHIKPLTTVIRHPNGTSDTRTLHASPELAMKYLLPHIDHPIFQIAHVYRNDDHSPLHRHEFTLLEWYRLGQSSATLINDCHHIMELARHYAPHQRFSHPNRTSCAQTKAQAMTIQECLHRHSDIDIATCLTPQAPYGDLNAIRDHALRLNIHCAHDDTWDDVFHRLFLATVQPHLNQSTTPILLTRYPRPLGMLARPCDDDPRFCQRFELFVCGIELAHGYVECRSADENLDALRTMGTPHHHIHQDFITALHHHPLPPCCGMALGVERLLMLTSHRPTLHTSQHALAPL